MRMCVYVFVCVRMCASVYGCVLWLAVCELSRLAAAIFAMTERGPRILLSFATTKGEKKGVYNLRGGKERRMVRTNAITNTRRSI